MFLMTPTVISLTVGVFLFLTLTPLRLFGVYQYFIKELIPIDRYCLSCLSFSAHLVFLDSFFLFIHTFLSENTFPHNKPERKNYDFSAGLFILYHRNGCNVFYEIKGKIVLLFAFLQ